MEYHYVAGFGGHKIAKVRTQRYTRFIHPHSGFYSFLDGVIFTEAILLKKKFQNLCPR
jgi:hypothetical protein